MSSNTRTQLTHVVGLHIAPARVRRFIDKRGMNRTVEDAIQEEKNRILAIMKEGAAAVSVAPTRPAAVDGVEPTPAAVEAYTTALNTYNTQLAAYKNYKSDRYNTLVSNYEFASDLTKLQKLLRKRAAVATAATTNTNDKKRFTTKNSDELARLLTKINTENAAAVRNVDLNNLDAVTKTLTGLQAKYPDLVHFFNRDANSAKRIRFNDHATVALATVMESIVEQLTEHSMSRVVELGKKIIQPDHCVSEGLENCSLYPLFCNLPAMQAIRARQQRRNEYDTNTRNEQADANRKAKAEARRRGKSYRPVKVVKPSFEQTEVEGGYAKFVDAAAESADAEATTQCQWFGIDVPASEADTVDTTDFVHYVDILTKNFKKVSVDDGNNAWSDIRISGNIRNFFSNIMIQFVARMLPLISLTISFKKNEVKTVCNRTIMRVVEMLLADSNHNPQGLVKFSPSHNDLFNLVDQKLKLLETHLQSKADRKNGTEEEEVDEETTPTPVPASTPAVAPTPVPEPVAPPADSARQRRARKP